MCRSKIKFSVCTLGFGAIIPGVYASIISTLVYPDPVGFFDTPDLVSGAERICTSHLNPAIVLLSNCPNLFSYFGEVLILTEY